MRLLILSLLLAASLHAAAPPGQRLLTAAQLRDLYRQVEWLDEARRLLDRGEKTGVAGLLDRSLRVERAVFGQVRMSVILALEERATLHEENDEFDAAARLRAEAVAALEAAGRSTTWQTVELRVDLDRARKLAKLSVRDRVRVAQAGIDAKQARKLYRDGKFAEAAAVMRRVLTVHRELFGEQGPQCLGPLNNLALLYERLGVLAAARKQHQQAVEIARRAYGENGPKYATCLSNLGVLLVGLGEPAAAVKMQRQALAIRERALGPDHPDCFVSHNNLSMAQREAGDLPGALRSIREALRLLKRHGLLGTRDHATVLTNAAAVAMDRGDLTAALAAFREVVALDRRLVGPRHPDYATSVQNLAIAHSQMGDDRAAVPLYREAAEITRRVLGARHPTYATHLSSLAMALSRQEAAAAIGLLHEVEKITRASLGETHPRYATTLNNLAGLYAERGDGETAFGYYARVEKIRKATLGEGHPLYAQALLNHAVAHLLRKEVRDALPLARQATEIYRKALGEQHPEFGRGLHHLALIHHALGRPAEARKLAARAAGVTRSFLDSLATASERQQLQALRLAGEHLELLMALTEGDAGPYEHLLAWKGGVFAQRQRRPAAATPEASRLREELDVTSRKLLAVMLGPPAADTAARVQGLTRRREELEAKLPGRAGRPAVPTPKAIADCLPADAVLVDFLLHNRPDVRKGTKAADHRLVAFVVRRGQPVKRIELGAAGPVVSAVTDWRRLLMKGHGGEEQAATVRKLVWGPLLPHLKGAGLVLLSPDGPLSRVPFAALPGSRPGTFLIEEVRLGLVPVPRLLPELVADRAAGPERLVAVGDVNFKARPPAERDPTSRTPPPGLLRDWQALPATAPEARAVHDLFRKQYPTGTAEVLERDRATKPAVRAALEKGGYAHLATHGFFAPAELRQALAESGRGWQDLGREGMAGWHPGLLSGLVLAGANATPRANEEDGILTALEVADLDLSGLELAVLSACETGLGRLAGGEGVLGLQRAFQAAGCKRVVSSLWSVNDAATSVLMERFYLHLWQKKASAADALRQAQLDVLRHPEWVEERVKKLVADGTTVRGVGKVGVKLPGGGERRSPTAWWAAFVLSGDWR